MWKRVANKVFPGALPVGLQADALMASLTKAAPGFAPPLLASSRDITCPRRPDADIAAQMAAHFPASSATPLELGGLGGIPFAGRSGWKQYRQAAAAAAPTPAKTDLLVVYHADVDAAAVLGDDGGVPDSLDEGARSSAVLDAWRLVEDAGGIVGLSDDLLRDRHDSQQAFLCLKLAAEYEDITPHPEPLAKLAYVNFGIVQDYLREVIDWSELRDVRLAALGGLTIHSMPTGPEGRDYNEEGEHAPFFLPVTFELLDTQEGALHDLLDDSLPDGTARPFREFLFPISED